MAKKKETSETSAAPRKSAAKKAPAKSAAKKVVETSNPVAEKIAAKAPAVDPLATAAPVRTARPSSAELYDEVRRRAFEFYKERGGEHGSHEADWHRAEAEVRAKYK